MATLYSVFRALSLLVLVNLINGQKSCNIKEVDLCVSNYLYGQNGVPINEIQLKKLCDTSRELETCLWTYFKRCFNKLQNEMAKWVGSALTKTFNDRCLAPRGHELREEIFRYAPCLNSIAKEQRKCYDTIRLPLEYMVEQRYHRRVPIGCCAARKTMECLYSVAEKKCGKADADFIKRFYPVEEFLETICEGYELGSKICAESAPPIGWTSSRDSKSILNRVLSVYLGI